MVAARRAYEAIRVCLRVFRRLLDEDEVEVEADVTVGIGDEVPVSSGSSSSISMYCSMVGSAVLAWIPSSSCAAARGSVPETCRPVSWRKKGELDPPDSAQGGVSNSKPSPWCSE